MEYCSWVMGDKDTSSWMQKALTVRLTYCLLENMKITWPPLRVVWAAEWACLRGLFIHNWCVAFTILHQQIMCFFIYHLYTRHNFIVFTYSEMHFYCLIEPVVAWLYTLESISIDEVYYTLCTRLNVFLLKNIKRCCHHCFIMPHW